MVVFEQRVHELELFLLAEAGKLFEALSAVVADEAKVLGSEDRGLYFDDFLAQLEASLADFLHLDDSSEQVEHSLLAGFGASTQASGSP